MNKPSTTSPVHWRKVKTILKQEGFTKKSLSQTGDILIHVFTFLDNDSVVVIYLRFDQTTVG